MAKLIEPPQGGGPVGGFERLLVEALVRGLPADYIVIPNFSLREAHGQSYEIDVVVFAPHAVYLVEAKEWYGRLTGDDTEWLLNQSPRRCPLWLLDKKAKVLKHALGAPGRHLWTEAALVVPDGTILALAGNWARNAHNLSGLVAFLQTPPAHIHKADLRPQYNALQQQLLGTWIQRRRGPNRRVGGYEIVELLHADDEHAEYRARRAFFDEKSPYRIRIWPLSAYLKPEEREARLNLIRRPTQALAKIGRHPNLLQILDFNETDDGQFYEVTEWSDYGTLHGYLRNDARDRLTLRDRLEIAAGVAAALEVVHAHEVVHRNVCPETIHIAFDRSPRLTDFDRAYLENTRTVFPGTEHRRRNPAYVAPELRDPKSYDFDTCSDMYSFGALLYELLTDQPPPVDGPPPAAPSALREGVDPKLDTLVDALLQVENFRARPTAAEALAVLREVLGSSAAARRGRSEPPPGPTPPRFENGEIIDGEYRIDGKLGQGGFSRVYKVYHLDQGTTYAMKLLDRSDDVDLLLKEFNNVGRSLPTHKNIARMIWMGRLAPPASTPYILSELVDGETLEPYCNGQKRLPWTDIQRIGMELCDALAAMHPKTEELAAFRSEMQKRSLTEEQYDEYQRLQAAVAEGILHRDIKPQNILLELPSHTAKLIDFNIASKLHEAKGKPGTPRYWAPDRGAGRDGGWDASMDLFSLGVVLYELVTHRHPFPDDNPDAGQPYDPRDVRPDLHLGEGLAAFLLKTVQPEGSARFQTAREMREALARIPAMHAPAPVAAPVETRDFPGITLLDEEKGKADYNPYVTRLLTLYSQARRTNAGTRGLDEIARLTYVRTRLDEALAPRIADGKFRLVIVTGNAGDGKTAFLQQVEAYFQEQLKAEVEALPTGNGSRWTHGELAYETNYDGSQDEGDTENDEVLARFLEPFAGASLGGLDGGACRLIAINEGRLLDFLEHSSRKARFEGLRRFVMEALHGEGATPRGALLVNLNLRAIAAGGKESLVERQLERLLSPELWTPCEGCAHKARCPVKHNADSLRDEASGPAVRERIRRLFEVVHLRRRAHVTMRDLRSALSWILLRDQGCEDVAALLEGDSADVGEALVSRYYPEALAADAGHNEDRVDDRLVRLLREADVGLVNTPDLDRRLDHDPRAAVPWMTFERRSSFAREVVEKISGEAPASTDDTDLGPLLEARRARIARWRRWAYYERRDEGWQRMIPYRSLALLEKVMIARSEEQRLKACALLRDKVLDAISLSEGLRSHEVRAKYLALRVSRVRSPSVRSFRLFPREDFDVRVPSAGGVEEFLEYAPDAVELAARRGGARMRISLDLLEMLELIRSGYRPSPADLQGLFVNLQIFRNELLSLPFHRILLAGEDEELFEVSASTEAGGIQLALTRYAVQGSEEVAP